MDYNEVIESICFKFGHAVTEYDVFRWLRNFDEEEWPMALTVLDKVVYYSSDRIEETVETGIKKIIESRPFGPVVIIPVAGVGKSGHFMAYHAKKVIDKLGLKDKYLRQTTLNDLNTLSEQTKLVLLDDFSGTGESIEKFYQSSVKEIVENKKLRICCLSVAYMREAKAHLSECGIDIYGDEYGPAFERRGGMFGYERNMIPIRDFCFKKGEMLFPNWKKSSLKPLGYNNSQALVCFEHTTPNNTLPIFWYEGKIPGTDRIWSAIFPRFVNSRIERGRRWRKSAAFWLSAVRKLNLPNIDWASLHTVDSLRLICVIAFKYRQKSDYFISNCLGITAQDVASIVKSGQEKGLLSESGALTREGRTIYEELRKKDRILEHDVARQLSQRILYAVFIPKSFRGMT